MRTLKTLVLAVGVLSFLAACQTVQHEQIVESKPAADSNAASRISGEPVTMKEPAAMSPSIITSEGGRNTQFDQQPGGGSTSSSSIQRISLSQAEQGAPRDDRKIIRNAELTLQAKTPESAQRSLEQIAESLGGFIVSSEINHTPQLNGGTDTSVNVVLRVPSARFSQAIASINGLDGKIIEEKISGQDVTEEYIDLDARLKSKQALEAQFLEIMKQAHKVSDALEVESQLSDVRAQIEQLQGRKRFLENQSSLSTITVHLVSTAPVITASKSGFLQSVSLAFGDCIDTGAAIINGFIRFLGVLVPVALLILLPLFFVLRVLLKRFKPIGKPEPAPSITGQA